MNIQKNENGPLHTTRSTKPRSTVYIEVIQPSFMAAAGNVPDGTGAAFPER